MKKLQNISFADISRFRSEHMGIAMLIIILFHVALPRSDAFFGLRRIGNLGVDMFLFLSGVGLWFSWAKNAVAVNKQSFVKEWASFYKRRMIRVYPTWLVIASLYYIPRYHGGWDLWTNSHRLADLFADITINKGFWFYGHLTFWYIPAIMVLYVFAPPFMELIRRYPIYKWLVLIFVLWPLAVQWVTPIHDSLSHLEIFFSRVPIFFLGICMGDMVRNKRSVQGNSIWLIAIMFIMTLFICVFLEQNIHGRFPLFIERLVYIPLTVTFIILLGLLFTKTPRWLNYSMAWVGAISLETYLIHSEFILWRVEQYHLGYWFTFLVTAAISLTLAWLLHKVMDRVTSLLTKVL